MKMAKRFSSVGVIGAGAWGTALASLSAMAGAKTMIWARNADLVASIEKNKENKLYLPGYALPEGLRASADLSRVVQAEALLFVVPAQQARHVLMNIKKIADGKRYVAMASKGIEQKNLKLMPDVLHEVWPEAGNAILTGPSFAHDVVNSQPTAVTLASDDQEIGARWIATLGTRNFRPYLSDDLIGAALGGAVKNVLAIGAGVVDGMGLGESARAALIARGFAEFQRLGRAKGAKLETMAGLSGLGDLILTANSTRSRNMSLGQALGRGEKLSEILAARNSVSEGVSSASAVIDLAEKSKIDMPICQAVYQLVEQGQSVDEVMNNLLGRPFRKEVDG